VSNYTVPAVGALVLVTLPHPYAGPVRCRVAAARDRELTLHLDGEAGEPAPPPGTPCLVASLAGDDPPTDCEAVVVALGASVLVVDMARDPRRHSRHRRPWAVRIEPVSTTAGVVDATVEDVSVGGMRVRGDVLLPVEARVFVSILLADAPPLPAIAEVRAAGAHPGGAGYTARLQFTVMARSQYVRLATVLASPSDDASTVVERHRHQALNLSM